MKKALLIMSMIVISLTACKKPEARIQEEKAYERHVAILNELKNKVPPSEIIGQVQGREAFIHRFYDEKNGTNCYFIDYDYKNFSCVK